ncbi:hypothetical protein BATDEDRAFT_33514 [Batrachochytrium dendrobatidis JAM81]|uniref:Small ribosomal subunit protein mS23 n=1 Tax=Batrachochytrium dendrobatidis (strain JAM81 / FGSC 10211) TaxID=684364 RepID=F4P7P3_BATDJ|nr:mitochondrial 37S ribosomal protein RSM25 [Batrachochytrium dendrobatidis JAM81]EGF78639.1 hypothetical protein BATDEDRAFT_33514 [Batrachochytrium dendrobatidis JAM81]KAJ8324144.1 mitochondrial ribosomal small subunit component [Batrachochytrium dendrobatidis]|eukprot:XP_006680768.1 hypothetical protein BATDEDRAFT_33514 [Batrachochytrium dendrobatidis JAM81]
MPIRLRHNPFKLPDQILNLQTAGKINALPAWYAAMQLHPPAPKPLQSVIPSEVGQFQPENGRLLLHQQQLAIAIRSARRRPKTLSVRKQLVASTAAAVLAVKNRSPAVPCGDAALAASLAYSVPDIVYPEDEIRRVFYKRHPFELDRARCIVEREFSVAVEWVDIHGGHALVPLSGESVVQRTMYLLNQAELKAIKEEKRTKTSVDRKSFRSTAYKQALTEFYAAREEEELRELKMYDDAEIAHKKSLSEMAEKIKTGEAVAPVSDTFSDPILGARHKAGSFWHAEEIELADSRLFSKDLAKQQESKKMMQDKLKAFDQGRLAQKSAGSLPSF